ncbi:MAG TPA: hypothetical protein EYP78_01950 [Candidatus Omnitrophica bacterium]|nr:hypothetical protein [Candidatus Omnitrophota bacterium]
MRTIAITVLFIVLLSASGLTIPESSPEEREFRAGAIIASKIEEQFPVSEDEEQISRVNRVGLSIVARMGSLRYPYSFTVLKIEDVNAFAIPGGFIYVTSGLLDLGLDDSELAFILGHEITHVEHNHILKRKRIAELLSLAMIGLEIYARSKTSSKDSRELQAEAAARSLAYSLSGAMIVSGYSREHEKEADYWGKIYAAKAGYELEGARTALEKIDIMKQKRPDLFSGLLMSHPYILDRAEEAEELIPEFPKSETFDTEIKASGNYIQSRLMECASFYEDKNKEKIALLLYRNAYYIYPSGREGDKALYKLLLSQEAEERKKNKFLINYNSLINQYQKILDDYPSTSLRKDIIEKLKKLKHEREQTYRWYEERIGTDMGLDYYFNFVEFFPSSPLVRKAKYYLAKKYLSAAEYNKSLQEFLAIIEQLPHDEWGKKSREEIIPVIEKATDIILLNKALNMSYLESTKDKIDRRMKKIIPQTHNFEKLNSFLREFPSNPYYEMVSERIEKLAEEKYLEARAQQLTGNWRKAVTIYREILKYAPNTSTSYQIKREFERLEKMRKQER